MTEFDQLRRDVMRMAAEVREMARPETENTAYEELYRDVLSAFVFGMVTAAGKENELMPEEFHGLTAICLHEVFQYCPEQAAQFVRELESGILNTAGEVIGRGVEGYPMWKNRDRETLRESLVQLLDYVERRERVEGVPLKHRAMQSRRKSKASPRRR